METNSHLCPSGAAKSSPASLYIDEPKEGKIIHFPVKIPVKIKLSNPLSPNNFTLSDKRLNSLKQVSQKYQRAHFPQVGIILYPQLNFKYLGLTQDMQYLKGGETLRESLRHK